MKNLVKLMIVLSCLMSFKGYSEELFTPSVLESLTEVCVAQVAEESQSTTDTEVVKKGEGEELSFMHWVLQCLHLKLPNYQESYEVNHDFDGASLGIMEY